MVGIADYLNNPAQHPVVIKVETGLANDFFVGFNRATGVNADNDEGDNVITIVQVDTNNGEGYSQSYLKAKLGFVGDITGSSYTIVNLGGTSVDLKISVLSINTSVSPATAEVKFEYGSNTPAPAAPTTSPSKSPTQSPVASTGSPTRSPIAYDVCNQYSNAKPCKNAQCVWLGGGICVSPGSSPSPPSPSPPTGPTVGVCSINSCTLCPGGGECRAAGCTWAKGTCS
jgi:hypothetical protein